MPHHTETHHFPYSTQQLYELVADVARYPEFLPWCRAARIIERHEGYFLAELVISFKHLTEQYTSRVHLLPPDATGRADIRVELVKGPFEHLDNHWVFTPEGNGCSVTLDLSFQFKNRFLGSLISTLFTRASEKMVMAFSSRADALYGGDISATAPVIPA